MQNFRLFLLVCCALLQQGVYSQDTTFNKQIPSRYFESVSKTANSLEQKLDKKSQKVLDRMKKSEEKLKRKLARVDSLAATNVFADSESKYKQLEERLKQSKTLSQYIPRLDTLATSFKFLEQHPQWLDDAKGAKEKFDDAFSKVKAFENQLRKAEDIKQFLKERKQLLKEQLEKFGLAKELKKINKEVYYYAQQVNEYKEILKDPKKIERKAIEFLSKTKMFQDFFKKNSVLASLFRMPGDPNDPNYQASLAGLQTRTQVNSLIQNQIAAGGPGAQQQLNQNLQGAQSQLQQLKDKLSKWASGNSDDIMPDNFKPNGQKTKSFWQRIELGSNIQSQRATNLFPVTSDIGLSIGYKLNDKSVIGFGTSYKFGWGTGWNNLRITHQGIGIRSFVDWKIKGSFWISGGYEQNYKSVIRSIDQLRDRSGWQQSGLIGVSKVVSLKGKFFKKTKVQLLWDFLSYDQIPKAQPIVFRIGYNF